MKISVVINTFNAEEFLERVLESVENFDEIVICDMHSTDKTLDIVSKYSCKLVFHERTGIVEPARSYAIGQASNEWILVVDADELVSPYLLDFLKKTVSENPDLGGIRIPRKNYILGRFMHSAYPDYILRFVKRSETIWPTTIHAHPIINGKIVTISSKRKDLAFIHLANEPIKVTIDKMNKYTEFETLRSKRKNKNYTILNLIFEPLLRFLRFYIFKGGFRDGKPGFIWASEYAYYKFVTIAKILESRVKPNDLDKDLRP